MEQVFLEYFYYLGKQIERIRNVLVSPNMEASERNLILGEAHAALATYLLQRSAELVVSYQAAKRLLHILSRAVPEDYMEIEELFAATEDFEQTLQVELRQSYVLMLQARGTHDSRILLLSPEASFQDKYWDCLSKVARKDWTEASRCLAYDISTGCGFHAIRTLEAVAIDYLARLEIKPTKRDLGHYLELLRLQQADPKAIEAADQLRGLHRNPLMHPEDFLDRYDAIDVFDLCKCAIRALLRDMEKRHLITPRDPVTNK